MAVLPCSSVSAVLHVSICGSVVVLADVTCWQVDGVCVYNTSGAGRRGGWLGLLVKFACLLSGQAEIMFKSHVMLGGKDSSCCFWTLCG